MVHALPPPEDEEEADDENEQAKKKKCTPKPENKRKIEHFTYTLKIGMTLPLL